MSRRGASARKGQAIVVVLDNEPVQALLDVRHHKNPEALNAVTFATRRARRNRVGLRLVVPTSVRVEAGWDRAEPAAGLINRLRVLDHHLDGPTADSAARIRSQLTVSVPDGHLGAVMATLTEPHFVITSDVDDVKQIAAHLGTPTTVVRL